MNRIFIGYESGSDIAFRVLRASLLKHASAPLEIRPLELSSLDFHRAHDPLASTEFTYTRFLVPSLCGFQGTALYMDCDMLCLGDVMELFALGLDGLALRVVKHVHEPVSAVKMGGKTQSRYPRKNWSSLMLLDCARLTAWTKEAVQGRSASWLHRFEPIADSLIGELPARWNALDRRDADTRLIHYTSGGPWLDACKDHPCAAIWFEHLSALDGTP